MKSLIINSYDVSEFTLKEVSEGVRVVMFLSDIYSYFLGKDNFYIEIKDCKIDIFIKKDLVENYRIKLYETSYYETKDVHVFTDNINERDFFSNINYLYKTLECVEYDSECGSYFTYDIVEDDLFGLNIKRNRHVCNYLDIKRFEKLLPEIDILKFSKFIKYLEYKIELKNINKKEIYELEERNKSIKNDNNFTDYEKETTIKRNKDRIEILKKEV